MTTKYQPLITRKDIGAIHKGNQLNRQALRAGLKELVSEVHMGNQQSMRVIQDSNIALIKGVHNVNQQSSRVVRKVADKWID